VNPAKSLRRTVGAPQKRRRSLTLETLRWFLGPIWFRPAGRFRGISAEMHAGQGVFDRRMSAQKQIE